MFPGLSGLTFKLSYAWLGLGFLFLISLILTVVYFFHWRRYGMNTKVVALSEAVYLITLIALFIIATSALLGLK